MAKSEEAKSTGTGKVKVKLFKDPDKYKDDVFVGCNGKNYQIKRGVEVEVPEAVAEIIEQSVKQDGETADLIARESAAGKKALASM